MLGNKELKEKYIEYYEDVPVQKYAAMFIGKDDDTIIRWRKEDKEFADRVEAAKALWVKKKVKQAKVEFALERIEKEVFSEKKIFEGSLTIADLLNGVDEETDSSQED